jgi:hypothetical protein
VAGMKRTDLFIVIGLILLFVGGVAFEGLKDLIKYTGKKYRDYCAARDNAIKQNKVEKSIDRV